MLCLFHQHQRQILVSFFQPPQAKLRDRKKKTSTNSPPLHRNWRIIPVSKWLGSHEWPFWKGSHNPILRGLTITMVMNHWNKSWEPILQVVHHCTETWWKNHGSEAWIRENAEPKVPRVKHEKKHLMSLGKRKKSTLPETNFIGFLRGGCPRGGGNWGTVRSPREDWGTLGNIRED